MAAFLLLSLVACAPSGDATSAKHSAELHVHTDPDLARRLDSWRAEAGVPGLGAAILRGDDLAVAVAGARRIDQQEPLVTTDAFHLGSDTKAITASVVARLVDRGVLRWNETLSEAMPDIADMDAAYKPVTLDMLMRHVAGLPQNGAFTPEFTAGFDDEHWPLAKQRAWMAQRFLSRPPAFPPGTKFAYSNYGYLILGHVVERATGAEWEELVRREVFDPLGMAGCGFGPTATDVAPANSWAHDMKDGRYVPTGEDNPPLIGPAGTVHCTLESWARFARAHAFPDDGGWISAASMAHLHEGHPFEGVSSGKNIALGWGVTRTDPPRLTHTGSNGYNAADIVVIPARHAAVLVVVNAGDDRALALSGKVRDALVQELLAENKHG
ncbi:MAG TPA: serine hydrolase domain-containing protein [Candidatus Polarisedimenticolaceae bacterium]|nr:serine hydrolase domain-containing protein [Candidatus Polarisedimenticolaceae bacterium]